MHQPDFGIKCPSVVFCDNRDVAAIRCYVYVYEETLTMMVDDEFFDMRSGHIQEQEAVGRT